MSKMIDTPTSKGLELNNTIVDCLFIIGIQNLCAGSSPVSLI